MRIAGRLPAIVTSAISPATIGATFGSISIDDPKTLWPISCAKPKPSRYPAAKPSSAVIRISVITTPVMERSLAPIAFSRPISLLRSITEAVTRLEMPSAEPTRLRAVIRIISSLVLSRMVPSLSATFRTAVATDPVITSWIW